MKFSLESIKISIAGAKLSHLVQKDRIWDHGSMTEQARIIFYLVHKSKTHGNIELLKKCVTSSYLETLVKEMNTAQNIFWQTEDPVITELAVIEVSPYKINKPDMFTAIIKGHLKIPGITSGNTVKPGKFSLQWCFVRQGEWWMLDRIKT
ncbi:MAG TPA: hypothetical protein VFT15_01410 [Chitinophagaceae bacterium]|nr:hypothetical protein [Chitinophagaceae bacterium]